MRETYHECNYMCKYTISTDKLACEHNEYFEVMGYNQIGYGTCFGCQREINLSILFNNLIKRLHLILWKMEKND